MGFKLHPVAAALLGLAILALSGCAKAVYAPDITVQEKAYTHDAPPSLTLLTMISNSTGSGGHSALLINGTQRVMYDPAGRFKSAALAERNDVLFGVKPAVLRQYNSFHARDTHHILIQEVTVSPAVAELAMREALRQGASHDAMCAMNTSDLLARIPGFETIGSTWFPAKLAARFEKIPGVKTTRYYEADTGQNYQ